MVGTARADDELPDAACCVTCAIVPLGRKPFVDVVVSIEDDVGVVVVEQRKEIERIVVGPSARRKERDVPEGQGTARRMSLEVFFEPGVLDAAWAAAADLTALGVECDEMPAADVEAVVALVAVAGRAGVAAGAVEVVIVGSSIRCHVIVIAADRMGNRPETAPGRAVEVLVTGGRGIVTVVADGEHRGRWLVDDDLRHSHLFAGSAGRPTQVTADNVARRHDYRRGARDGC